MPRRYLPAKLRKAVAERAQGFCEYCLSPVDYAVQSFSVEHIIPRSKGGTDDAENLAFACMGCNDHKYDKTEHKDPVSEVITILFHPRHHEWSEHFMWEHTFTEMVGITAIGRATIDALQLNRKGVVNLRRLLRLINEHPPK